MTTRELLHDKRDEILALAAKHKAHNVRVFGSVVRGDEGPESDVDFLVEFEEGVRLMDKLTLMVELEEILGRQADVLSPDRLDPRVLREVQREAMPL